MSFDWTDFLTLAEALKSAPDSPGPPEAALRSSVSRAYYAAFHYAMNVAREEGYTPSSSGDDHKNVQAHFRHYKPTDVRRKIALDLDRLRNNRSKADYEDTLSSRAEYLAGFTINMAKSVFNNLNSLSG